jgi:hypothetical protein
MKFLFICPLRQASFFSADFQVTDSRGVAADDSGNRYLDAHIKLAAPCPFCGE